MEQLKKCFKCGRLQPLDMFYKHPKMADGHLNKCKDCTKKDVHNKYMENINNPEFVEKQRIRGREKFHRLGYKNIYSHAHPETKDVARKLRRILEIPTDCEIHHWNYNFKYDIFILTKSSHKRVHKQISYDKVSKCFFYRDKILDTKQKHENAIRLILNIPQEQDITQYNVHIQAIQRGT